MRSRRNECLWVRSMFREIVALLSFSAAFAGFGAVCDGVVLSVNGHVLAETELDREVGILLSKVPTNRWDAARKSLRVQVARSFLMRHALVDAAKAVGLALDESELEARKADFVRRSRAKGNFESLLAEHPLGREAALEEFEAGVLIDKLMSFELAKALVGDEVGKEADRVILRAKLEGAGAGGGAEALGRIGEIRSQLNACPAAELAERFAELAKANSACPSSAKGGDLGFFKRGAMVSEFDRVAFALPVGRVSEPVRTAFGYHLILVTDKRADEVRASHILVKCGGGTGRVPSRKEALETARGNLRRDNARRVVRKALGEAKIETTDEFSAIVSSATR